MTLGLILFILLMVILWIIVAVGKGYHPCKVNPARSTPDPSIAGRKAKGPSSASWLARVGGTRKLTTIRRSKPASAGLD